MTVKISVSVEVRKTYHRATFYWRSANANKDKGGGVKYGKQMWADAFASRHQPPELYS